jgi:cytochrome b pre-mRNA-processing protein 3
MKSGLFWRSPRRDSIAELYGAIVAQARQAAFYRDYGVPDTVAGRLEMILLHAFLFSRRTRGSTDELRRLGQGVFDRFCDDMDANLREMGIGDLAVPKHMQRIGEAFYGRATAYDAAWAGEAHELADALMRNVFAQDEPRTKQAQRLSDYVKAADAQLSALADSELLQGRIGFPDPAAFRIGAA